MTEKQLKKKIQDLEMMMQHIRMDVYRRVINGQTDYVCFQKGKFNPKSAGIAKSTFRKVVDIEEEKLHLGYPIEGPELAEAKPKRKRRTKQQIEEDKKL